MTEGRVQESDEMVLILEFQNQFKLERRHREEENEVPLPVPNQFHVHSSAKPMNGTTQFLSVRRTRKNEPGSEQGKERKVQGVSACPVQSYVTTFRVSSPGEELVPRLKFFEI